MMGSKPTHVHNDRRVGEEEDQMIQVTGIYDKAASHG